MENNKISVVINTYNADKYLDKSLEAVKDFDEIVICDMESTDNTLGIAKKYNCKIVTFPKANHKSAEPARTFAIQSASNYWVLVVDADEIITPELRNELYSRITKPDCPAGYYVTRKNKNLGKFSRDWGHDYQLRFFKREGTVWPPYVHTFPIVQGEVKRLDDKYFMLHLADETIQQWVSKMNEYTDGEVDKKAKKKYGIFALFFRPMWRFFKNYILMGAFLNGKRGILQSLQWSIYQQILIMKCIEKQLRENG